MSKSYVYIYIYIYASHSHALYAILAPPPRAAPPTSAPPASPSSCSSSRLGSRPMHSLPHLMALLSGIHRDVNRFAMDNLRAATAAGEATVTQTTKTTTTRATSRSATKTHQRPSDSYLTTGRQLTIVQIVTIVPIKTTSISTISSRRIITHARRNTSLAILAFPNDTG